MVRAGNALRWHQFAGERSKAALHSVPNDGAADLLRDGETDAHPRIVILAIADEQDEAGGCGAKAAVGGKEVRALLDRA